MNFEFLKNLRGFDDVYENCCNAEKLAITMPVQSVFTSGKSAELLAKFIYMTAHKQEMEGLTFADILKDNIFQRFINNRDVMDAFHYIRKKRNQAAHSDAPKSQEDAISVLQDLHYVAGETARRLRLIKDYPVFEDRIDSYPNAVFVDEKEIDKKAMKMFFAYVEEFHELQEQDQYIEEQDYDIHQYSIEGNVEIHEYLEFRRKPKYIELVKYLQNYLSTLLRLSVERSPVVAEESDLSYPVILSATIMIGGNAYKSSDPRAFATAISEELPKADSFEIDCICSGVLREFFNDELEEDGSGKINMIRKDAVWTGAGMLDKLESFKRRERFTYHNIVYYPDSGNVFSAAIIDGKSMDVTNMFSEHILEYPDMQVDCDGISIHVRGKTGLLDYPQLFEAFKAIIRDNVSEYSLPYCEAVWDPDDDEYIENCLLPFVPIKARSVGEYVAFLNQLNSCIEPWKDEIQFVVDEPNLVDPLSNDSANILYNIPDLSLAVIEVRDGRLCLTGTVFDRREPNNSSIKGSNI